jgi:hypothetical protein
MMREAWAVLAGAILLTGCGDAKEAATSPRDAERDVAMVERMNQTPFKAIRPEPFSRDDLARYGLERDGCMFRPGDKGDGPPLFVAQQDRGYLKVNATLQPLSVKSGSAELPSGAHSTYMGLDSWIELVAQAGGEASQPGGRAAWPSRLVIHDAEQRIAFDVRGLVSCAGANPTKARNAAK